MLVFKKITWKNFLATGNVPNSIELNNHHSTLITGKNGEGKSTILCALTFGLFGRPFRNVNKGQLVNSINKKNCLVEIEFTVNGHDYIVKRGIKPNVFEILCDGQLINQDAALKDYQKVLEQQILKLNYKTFTQVVILGSATYVPFMQLPSAQRRDVIEDILDIRVFSVMNQLLKEKAVDIKDQLHEIEEAIALSREKVSAQKKLIETISNAKTESIDRIQAKISQASDSMASAEDKRQSIQEEIDSLVQGTQGVDELRDDIRKATRAIAKVESKHAALEEHVSFLETNSFCPSCDQEISDAHKEKQVSKSQKELGQFREEKQLLEKALSKLSDRLEAIQETAKLLTDKNIEMSTVLTTISMLQKQITEFNQEITDLSADTSNVDVEKSKLREIADEAIKLVEQKTELLDVRQLHDIAGMLLKDTGIKTAIIREYLPVMNKLINKYLGAMDFFVKFELDESFQEVIKSRHRDTFTYDSFSEGEKRRLDLAILFTWRQIAKMKNSVNTNLLLLDEILDGALDAGGIDYFLNIMNQFGEHTNVFVISHKVHQMIDRFDHVVRIEKKNDFSVITVS